MAKPPPSASAADTKSEKKPGFFKSITGAIDEVMNEVKADLKAMTPPDAVNAKRNAEQAAYAKRMEGLISGSLSGLGEEIVDDAPNLSPLPPESDTTEKPVSKPATLPPGNLWQALTNAEYTSRLRTDACYHALTQADVEGYRRALAAEVIAPYTMGIAAIVLQAPLEEELEEGGAIVSDDMLLVTLLKALEETRLYGAIGAGPRQLWPSMDALDESLTTLLNAHPKLIALGPLGIDEPFAPYQLLQQQEQLALQLDIAADFDLPVILSQRQSLAHVRSVLEGAPKLPPLIWLDVLTTDEDLALVKDFNMYIVLRPEITTPNFPSGHLYTKVPVEKRLLASGSALVAPHGFSGHFNQPKFLQNSMQAAAKMLYELERDITSITNRNLANLFKK